MDNAIATQGAQPLLSEHTGGEMAVSTQAAMAKTQVEGAVILASRNPRNETEAFQRMVASCGRPNFAKEVRYTYKRGGTLINAPSVYFAREFIRCWRNVWYGLDVIHDDEECRTIRAWAWDLETNTRPSMDATFKKMIQRKDHSGATRWVRPDERDLREHSNNIGARILRNCLLQLLPTDLIEDALATADETLRSDIRANPTASYRKMAAAFVPLGVTVQDLEAYLGYPLQQASEQDIVRLRGIWKSIDDGESTWSEYAVDTAAPKQAAAASGGVTVDDLLKPQSQPAEPQQEPTPLAESAAQPPGAPTDEDMRIQDWRGLIDAAESPERLAAIRLDIAKDSALTPAGGGKLKAACTRREKQLKPAGQQDQFFDKEPSAIDS